MKKSLLNLQRISPAIILSILITLFMQPIGAQTSVRDHRTNTSTSKPSKMKVSNTASSDIMAPSDSEKPQILYFDEADALFGKRTALMEKTASFEYVGEMDTVHVTQKLHEGDNSVYIMKSGNTMHALVKNGRIAELVMRDKNRKEIQVQDTGQNPVVSNQENPVVECLNCKEICVDEIDEIGFPTGGIFCFTQCTKVNCDSKDNNAILLPDKNKK